MDKDIAALLNLPWATLVTLASGYAGYYIANVGIRSHHKAIDIAFSTIVFGFLGSFTYQIAIKIGYSLLVASAAAFIIAPILGALWRKFGRGAMQRTLRVTSVSYSDDLPDAWKQIFATTDSDINQITVKLTDGTWLHCDNLESFKNEPCGPCTLGESGDILMYATHQKLGNEESFRKLDDIKTDWGTQASYIPKDKIAFVDLRFQRRS